MPRTRTLAALGCSPLSPMIGLAAAGVMLAGSAEATTLAAWVQLIGPGGEASIRVITDENGCPELSVDGKASQMQVRAEPGPLFADAASMPPADFPVRVCEAVVPRATTKVVLQGTELPLPRAAIRRVVVLGDTGCRINKKKIQDCNDGNKWPYAKLAKHAAAANPDVVIHVGDYLYREKPCSAHVKDCPDSPTGYDWKVWNADFFTPSQPLFEAAPWIMLRGNHETCDRAGEGWFRFLDHAGMSPNCLALSDFFVVRAGDFGFVALDSAMVANAKGADDDDDDDDDDTASGQADGLVGALRHNYSQIAPAIPPTAWLLSHVSFNAVRVSKKTGKTEADNTLQQEALGSLLSPRIQMIVSGHIHMFEALSFDNDMPPQLVVGTGGTKLAKKPEDPKQIGKANVTSSLIKPQFSYMLWERDDQDAAKWRGTLFGDDGSPTALCQLVGRTLDCKKSQ